MKAKDPNEQSVSMSVLLCFCDGSHSVMNLRWSWLQRSRLPAIRQQIWLAPQFLYRRLERQRSDSKQLPSTSTFVLVLQPLPFLLVARWLSSIGRSIDVMLLACRRLGQSHRDCGCAIVSIVRLALLLLSSLLLVGTTSRADTWMKARPKDRLSVR